MKRTNDISYWKDRCMAALQEHGTLTGNQLGWLMGNYRDQIAWQALQALLTDGTVIKVEPTDPRGSTRWVKPHYMLR
jgi:hypothetical protein